MKYQENIPLWADLMAGVPLVMLMLWALVS